MSSANGFFDSSREPLPTPATAKAASRSRDVIRLRRTSLAGALALLVLLLASLVMQPAHAAPTPASNSAANLQQDDIPVTQLFTIRTPNAADKVNRITDFLFNNNYPDC